MECFEAVKSTKNQVKNLPKDFKRLVITVGSAMSLCGILHGFRENNINKPIIAIIVGASPYKRLLKYAPFHDDMNIEFIKSKYNYSCHLLNKKIGKIELDPVYEAKALSYLEKGDLFWIIGKRK